MRTVQRADTVLRLLGWLLRCCVAGSAPGWSGWRPGGWGTAVAVGRRCGRCTTIRSWPGLCSGCHPTREAVP
ncbi:hypothetical protein [Mycobacterium intracellulare]|uniref:hypothetical protein n=1 Tax=Mycobacterium intracellulare TaxID=1767 RepID=UPI0009500ADB|nr:hypothetical protein [Mycobacterium intracellulare]